MTLATEDRQMLRDTATAWAKSRYDDANRRRASLTSSTGFDPAIWSEMADMGWLSVAISTDAGGLGGSAIDLADLFDALGGSIIAEPLLAVAGVAGPLMAQMATPDQVTRLINPILAGEKIAVLAHFEELGGYDRDSVQTSAVPNGLRWHLNGKKIAVPFGRQAHQFLISARDRDGVVGIFLMDRGAPGLSLESFRSIDGRSVATLALDNAEVERLGMDGAAALDLAIDHGAALAMAEASGLMARAIDDTAAFLKSRVQFGRPLSSFQALQHRCVDMYVMMMESKATAKAAAAAIACQTTTPDDRRKAVATAKVTAGRSAVHVSREIIQLHGGMGMSDEMPVGDMAKRLMVLESLFGSSDYYLNYYAAFINTLGDKNIF